MFQGPDEEAVRVQQSSWLLMPAAHYIWCSGMVLGNQTETTAPCRRNDLRAGGRRGGEVTGKEAGAEEVGSREA